jgi:hypothetical protein
MSNTLSNEELIELLPKISIGSDKPKTQVWLNQADALRVMRVVETEVLRRTRQDPASCLVVEKSQLPDACWNIVNPDSV